MSGVELDESFVSYRVTAEELDKLLAKGWRHFGIYFFRYAKVFSDGNVYNVIPLRIRLEKFSLSKSLRRIIKRNKDLNHTISPAVIDNKKINLFEIHKSRFKRDQPKSIYTFINQPPTCPYPVMELSIFKDEELIAVSFFEMAKESLSSIYGMFNPKESSRSLGIYTMLLEIDLAISSNKKYYYQGYAYKESSFYDYKKRFRGTEMFDWTTQKWQEFHQDP